MTSSQGERLACEVITNNNVNTGTKPSPEVITEEWAHP